MEGSIEGESRFVPRHFRMWRRFVEVDLDFSSQGATKTSCVGCRTVRPTCRRQHWQGMVTKWQGCATLGTAVTSWSTVSMTPSMVSTQSIQDLVSRVIHHQCGFQGCQVREASNFVTRQGRRSQAFHDTHVDVSSDEEPLVRRNTRGSLQ